MRGNPRDHLRLFDAGDDLELPAPAEGCAARPRRGSASGASWAAVPAPPAASWNPAARMTDRIVQYATGPLPGQPGVLNVALDQATALQCDSTAGGNLLHPYGTLRGRRRRQMPKHRPRAVESQNYAVQKGRRCRGALMPPSRSRSAPGCVCSGAAPIEQRAIPDRSVRGRSTRGTTTPTPNTWPTRSRKPTIAGWRV